MYFIGMAGAEGLPADTMKWRHELFQRMSVDLLWILIPFPSAEKQR